MKIFKSLLICLLVAGMSMLSLGCAELGEFSVNEKIVCEVDGDAVTYDDYKYFFYRHYISFYGDDFSELTEEKFNAVKTATEESLRRRAYMFSLIDEYDIELSDKDEETVDSYVKNQIEEQGSEEKYQQYLLDNRMTGLVFREQVELTFFYDKMLRELLATGIDKRIDMADEAVVNDVMGGGFYRYSQIYFEVDAGEYDTEAREKIEMAYSKLQSGYTFSQVALAEWASNSSTKAKYTSEWNADAAAGVYVAKGEKEAILEQNVLALEEGQYSEPIWSGSGWHIFMRLPLDENYVSENIHTVVSGEHTIAEQSFARRYLEYIEKGAEKIEIEYAKYFTETVTFSMLMQKEKLK